MYVKPTKINSQGYENFNPTTSKDIKSLNGRLKYNKESYLTQTLLAIENELKHFNKQDRAEKNSHGCKNVDTNPKTFYRLVCVR